MKNQIPVPRYTPKDKHVVWSEKIDIHWRFSLPKKVLTILNKFITKTNKLITIWRRIDVHKYKNYWFWYDFVYLVQFSLTWESDLSKCKYWWWMYQYALYLDKDWNCLNQDTDNFYVSMYNELFSKS